MQPMTSMKLFPVPKIRPVYKTKTTTGEAQSSPESMTGKDDISIEAYRPTMITEAKTRVLLNT